MEASDGKLDLRVWGKSRHLPQEYPLIWHLVDTAAVALALWDFYLTAGQRALIVRQLGTTEEHARILVGFWAGLHDVGKATPEFQMQEPGSFAALGDPGYAPARGGSTLRHDLATQLALTWLLKDMGYPDGRRRSRHAWYRIAQVLGGHHGRFRQSDDIRAAAELRLGAGSWAAQRAALVEALYEALGRPDPPTTVGGLAAVHVTGVVILADWLASQEHYLRRQLSRVPTTASPAVVAAHLKSLAPAAADLLEEAGLGRAGLRRLGFEEVFPFSPNALQRSVIDELLPRIESSGLLVVTAATGDGKTEAALVAASALAEAAGAGGFYFALPTMATSDEMYRRVRAFADAAAAGPMPVTLLHSMSWLNDDYAQRCVAGVGDSRPVSTDDPPDDRASWTEATRWLRGPKRGLLAGLAVGTVDQALVAALTTKHNALRLLGLSSKVFIVDEAHAYDEYMQALLARLLTWLGAFGCPVVLLSATLPSSRAAALVRAYRQGAAGTDADVSSLGYPGWLFVPADPAREVVAISDLARGDVVAGRRIRLRTELVAVRYMTGDEVDESDRRSLIKRLLKPIRAEGGHVAVVCNTVADAQQTYRALSEWADDTVTVVLLHSRFPAHQRERSTRSIVDRLGRNGRRRGATIVVATQVIEQSLDLDFDLMISDLAPLAQLLQRAGRCHRHPRPGRPQWTAEPRLVVLDPHGDRGPRPPRHWGDVYHRYLLDATRQALVELAGGVVEIPDMVQPLMERVHPAETVAVEDELRMAFGDYIAEGRAKETMATFVQIPLADDNLNDLSALSNREVAEADATTRLGAESVRVLCCYLDADHGRWLDPQRTRPLPAHGTGTAGRFSTEDVGEILRETIPVRKSVLHGYQPPAYSPASWTDNAWLADLVLLWFQLEAEGVPAPTVVNGRRVSLDRELGLVVDLRDDLVEAKTASV